MLKPVEKQRVAEEIVDQLRGLILRGEFAAGAKLPPERELAKTLGVNRASLREALKELEHLGLVRIRQGDGTRVQNFMETSGIELVRHLVAMGETIDPKMAKDVLEFRRVIGKDVAALAAERAGAHHVERLREIAARVDSAEPEDIFEIDLDFYVALTAAAGNRVLQLLINSVRHAVSDHSKLLAKLIVSADAMREHHQKLITAVGDRDPDAAIRYADEYLSRGLAHVMAFLGETTGEVLAS